jgi:hypothetical protein
MTNPRAVLLWGVSSDPPISAVEAALRGFGFPSLLLDQRNAPDTELTLSVAGEIEGALRLEGETFDLSMFQSVYLRPQESRALPDATEAAEDRALRHVLAVEDMLLSWCDLTQLLVINRPRDMAANNSKPFQAAWIESLGFKTPHTLITTAPEAALRFYRKHERVIYKSLSGIRSIVSQLNDSHTARFDDIASCPTQFQQYVEGREYRVHVIGETVLACEIVSAADDYRYSSEPVIVQPCELPAEVAARCAMTARSMKLWFAGLDLRRTPDGDWYCFEVNPSPGFTYFEQAAGLPIADTVARLLMSGHVNSGCTGGKAPPCLKGAY